MLEHPNIPSCATCLAVVVQYDFKEGRGSGKPLQYQTGPDTYADVKRDPVHTPAPCMQKGGFCPKGKPEREHEYVLSERNRQTLAFWRATKATGYRGLSEYAAADPFLQQNFSMLDSLFGRHEREVSSNAISMAVDRAVGETLAAIFGK